MNGDKAHECHPELTSTSYLSLHPEHEAVCLPNLATTLVLRLGNLRNRLPGPVEVPTESAARPRLLGGGFLASAEHRQDSRFIPACWRIPGSSRFCFAATQSKIEVFRRTQGCLRTSGLGC